ncbi:MAG: sulfotransferase family 2 domain-containing protein [Oceanicoccus sp.]
MLVFVHIPKAAGTTLHHVLKRAVGARKSMHAGKSYETKALREMPPHKAQKFKLISAHMIQPELEKICGKKAEYVTVTRDPVDRFISLYYFILSQPQHEQYSLYCEMSFEQFLEKYETDKELFFINCQARYLCGENSSQKAIDYIENKFLLTAPIEKFDQFIWNLFAIKKWVPILFDTSNKNQARPDIGEISDDIKERIRYLFQEDALIHQYMMSKYK